MSATAPSQPFWLIWNPMAALPAVRHPSPSKAEQEARRLAREHPGQEFIVLRSVQSVKTTDPVSVTAFDLHDEEIPF